MSVYINLVITILIWYPCSAQTNVINAEKLTEDYDIFQHIFEQANAGLYKYHPKDSVDSVFLVNRKLINNKVSYRDFYNLVWDVIDFTGSSHNELRYPDSLDKVISQQKIFFPIPLKYLNGRLYSNFKNKEVPLGSEIISVNNNDAATFAKNLSKYPSTDGHNVTGKYAFLETDWLPFYIYLAYGEQNNFTIEYKKDNTIKRITIDAVDYKTWITNYKARFIPAFVQKKDKYSFRYIDKQTGLLTVNTFAIGGTKKEGHKKYAAFLDSVFTDVKTRKIKNLIVDVRENGGGNDPNDLLLYSYLTKRNFRENSSAFTLFNIVPKKNYFVEEEENEIKDLEEELKEEHNILKNGKYYQNESFNQVWQPKPNAFHGKIYLLISPFVASAGSLFASIVKSDSNTIVIGKESLGGYYGHTGHIPVTYKLPNTGLILTFSIVDLEQDVQIRKDQQYGDGIKPDYDIEPTIEEYLKSKDVVLDFTKQLIKKH